MRANIFHRATNTTAQTLVMPVARVNRVFVLDGNATAGAPTPGTLYTVVTGTPAAGQVQFTGKPSSPSATLTFATAPAAGVLVIVDADTWLPASQ